MFRFYLTAMLLLLLPAPAHAFADCDKFRLEDGQTLVELRAAILGNVPVRDRAVAKDIVIEFVDEPGIFGPFAEAQGGRNFVRIPYGFTKLLCDLTTAATITPHGAAIMDEVDACIDRGNELPPCLRTALDRYDAANEAILQGQTPSRRRSIENIFLTSMYFATLHEVAHVIFGHLALEPSMENEFSADLYASTYLEISGRGAGNGAFVFKLLAYLRDRQLDSHENYLCRFQNSANIFRVSENIPAHLYIFPWGRELSGNPDRDRILADRRDALRKISAGQRLLPNPPEFSVRCKLLDPSPLAKMHEDFVSLARFQYARIDSLPEPGDGEGAAAVMRRLIAIGMATREGRAVRMQLLALYADAYRAARPSEPMTQALRDALALPDMLDAATQDAGLLHRQLGQRLFYFPSRGRLAREDVGQIYQFLARGLDYGGYDPETYAAYIRLAIWDHRCDLARRTLETAFTPGIGRDFDPALPATLRKEMTAAGC